MVMGGFDWSIFGFIAQVGLLVVGGGLGVLLLLFDRKGFWRLGRSLFYWYSISCVAELWFLVTIARRWIEWGQVSHIGFTCWMLWAGSCGVLAVYVRIKERSGVGRFDWRLYWSLLGGFAFLPWVTALFI